MGKYYILLISFIYFSCSDSPVNTSPIQDKTNKQATSISSLISDTITATMFQTAEKGRRITIDNSNEIRFYTENGLETSISDYHGLGININNHAGVGGALYIGTRFGTDVYIQRGGDNLLQTYNTFQAAGYKSSKGTIGKTYTEEFEDKQGNMRTRVYENGLLVSYKINGVEQ